MKKFREILGFTLFELMVAVFIVSLLATIAYPSYKSSLQGARRTDAINNLLQFQLEQEKYRAHNPQYAADFTTLIGAPVAAGEPIDSSEEYYSLDIITAVGTISTNFTIVATAQGTQSDDSCGDFAVNQNGPITDNAAYAGANCWNQ